MITVYLLRHGETDFNAQNNRYCGRTDIPINAKGQAQALAVQQQVKGIAFDGVFSSPLKRALETAQIVSGKEVVTDERLIEVDFGQWEGMTRDQFDPSSWKAWSSNPSVARAGSTGETGMEVVSRVNSFFDELLRTKKEGTCLVVAHNGVNRLFMAHQLGMPLANYRRIVQHNSAITRITLSEEEGFVLEMLNARL